MVRLLRSIDPAVATTTSLRNLLPDFDLPYMVVPLPMLVQLGLWPCSEKSHSEGKYTKQHDPQSFRDKLVIDYAPHSHYARLDQGQRPPVQEVNTAYRRGSRRYRQLRESAARGVRGPTQHLSPFFNRSRRNAITKSAPFQPHNGLHRAQAPSRRLTAEKPPAHPPH